MKPNSFMNNVFFDIRSNLYFLLHFLLRSFISLFLGLCVQNQVKNHERTHFNVISWYVHRRFFLSLLFFLPKSFLPVCHSKTLDRHRKNQKKVWIFHFSVELNMLTLAQVCSLNCKKSKEDEKCFSMERLTKKLFESMSLF